jgi:hypothetical protein
VQKVTFLPVQSINPIFSDTEIKALEVERFTHPHPMVQRRMEALYFKSKGIEHSLILKICRISSPTLVRYLRVYEKEGLAGLKRLGASANPAKCVRMRVAWRSIFANIPLPPVLRRKPTSSDLPALIVVRPKCASFFTIWA